MPDARKHCRAAVYARISLDRTGAGLGVERQIEDCRRLCAARAYTLVMVLTDNDISAYSGRPRPAYRKLLAAMQAGEIDVVISWHTDRLHRSPRELEEYIAVSEAHHVDTVTVQAGELDLGTASGRMVARMLGAAARHESEQKSERIRRARQQAAEAGKSNGNLGYGYNRDQSINREQAAVLHEASERLLAGETLYAVTTDLNLRGIPSPRGRAGGWKSANLRDTLVRATVAGWREWRPGSMADKGGRGLGEFLARGAWEPILTRQQVERLRVVLFTRPAGQRPAENLLTGILRCGICKLGLNGSGDSRNKSNPRRYRCIHQPGDPHCGRVSIVAEPVEALVEAAVLAVLSGTRLRPFRAVEGDTTSAEKELLAAQRDRDELAAERGRGKITPEEWAVMRREVMARIDRAKQALALAGSNSTALDHVPTGKAALTWWGRASTQQRRNVIRALVSSVEIAPATNHAPSFDPSRVGEPVWLV